MLCLWHMAFDMLLLAVEFLLVARCVDNTNSASIAHVLEWNPCLICHSFMQAIGEGIKAATDDLRKKSISLAQSHYGSLSYILAYSASGYDCDIHIINTDGEVRPYDLHCVCLLIVQAFCHAEHNLWL